MISVRDLEFQYPRGDFRLDIPDFDVKAGESVAVVGPSGCGKTTLLQLLAGVLIPSSGSVTADRVNISALGIEDRQDFRAVYMGLIFQEFELLEYLDVTDNILLPYRISPVLQLNDGIRRRASELLDRVGLSTKSRSFVRQMSQGERQRTAVCRSLVTCPKILICDEPTANLDSENRALVIDALLEYREKEQVSLVVVTHDSEIKNRFDTILDMRTVGP